MLEEQFHAILAFGERLEDEMGSAKNLFATVCSGRWAANLDDEELAMVDERVPLTTDTKEAVRPLAVARRPRGGRRRERQLRR